jgi:hypothetical protein
MDNVVIQGCIEGWEISLILVAAGVFLYLSFMGMSGKKLFKR